jgi:hypothetical protein
VTEERAGEIRTVVYLGRKGSDITDAIERLHPDDRKYVQRAWFSFLIAKRQLDIELALLEQKCS